MREQGLVEVANASEYMLSGRPENASGSVVACTMEGTRPLLVEIQALVCQSNFGIPRRQTTGTDFNRVNLLMAVLEKRCGVQLAGCDAYVNITGGMKILEPAIDLGIVIAILSSFRNQVMNPKLIAFGEVGLSGEVRAVSQAPQRVAEARKLGFEVCVIPAVSVKDCTQELERGRKENGRAGIRNVEAGKVESRDAEAGKAELRDAEAGKAEPRDAEAGKVEDVEADPGIVSGQTDGSQMRIIGVKSLQDVMDRVF